MAHTRDISQRPVPSESQLRLAVCFIISALQAVLPFAKRTIKNPDTGGEVTMNDLENVRVAIIGGFALNQHIRDCRVTYDADLLVTGLDMPSVCRNLLKGSNFFIDGNILDVAVDDTFVKVDFVSERVLRPYSAIPVGYTPEGTVLLKDVSPGHLPFIGAVDLLLTKMISSGSRSSEQKKKTDVEDAENLALHILQQRRQEDPPSEIIPLSNQQKRVAIVALDELLRYSRYGRWWWKSKLALW